jgi:CDP-diacylglycerol--glycerol-3-phosphate 3-phosphatidyltransferase/cardiolipin synthase
MMRLRRALPSLVSASRIAAAPLLHHLIVSGRFREAAALVGCAAATDVLDGALARRLAAVSRAGAWVDVTADFVLVATGLAGLAAAGAAPVWVPLLAGLMFAQFVATSWRGAPIYDPIGKYYGGFLYAVLAAVLLAPDPAVWYAAPVAVGGMTAASIASRVAYYRRTSALNRRVRDPPRSGPRTGANAL